MPVLENEVSKANVYRWGLYSRFRRPALGRAGSPREGTNSCLPVGAYRMHSSRTPQGSATVIMRGSRTHFNEFTEKEDSYE